MSPHFDPIRLTGAAVAMLFSFLLVVHAIIAAALVTVILMQRSEGGGLTSGGSPSGLMSARGAADFLTRTTSILAGIFILFSILLAFLAATSHRTQSIDTSRVRAPAPINQPAPPAQGGFDAAAAGAAAATNGSQPTNSSVPLAQ
jgi:preprotein translocase subunit SecG